MNGVQHAFTKSWVYLRRWRGWVRLIMVWMLLASSSRNVSFRSVKCEMRDDCCFFRIRQEFSAVSLAKNQLNNTLRLEWYRISRDNSIRKVLFLTKKTSAVNRKSNHFEIEITLSWWISNEGWCLNELENFIVYWCVQTNWRPLMIFTRNGDGVDGMTDNNSYYLIPR